MRIISKFKDYYDIGLSQGIDDTLVYVREAKDIKINKDSNHDFDPWSQHQNTAVDLEPTRTYSEPEEYIGGWWGLRPVIIFFCGKTYVYWLLSNKHDPISNIAHCNTNVFRNEDTYSTSIDSFNLRPCYSKGRTKPFHSRRNEKNEFWDLQGKDCTELNLKYKSPIIAITEPPTRAEVEFHVYVNPVLKNLGFQKVLDPYQAFQEISMFVGGVLPQSGNEMVQIDDKRMAEKKGFGHKYAFRTEPTKRK